MVHDELERHYEVVRCESRKQARLRGREEISEDLRWGVERLEPNRDLEALDVAAGTGVVARAIAPYFGRVVASDVSPEMLAVAAEEAPAHITVKTAAAEDLPYAAGTFGLVASRSSVSQFLWPDLALREMNRVCRPGGALLLIDVVVPDDAICARRYNNLERSRNACHIRSLSASNLRETVEWAGWHVGETRSLEVARDVTEWLAEYPLDPIRSGWILRELKREIGGGPETGMRPFVDGAGLKLVRTIHVVRATK